MDTSIVNLLQDDLIAKLVLDCQTNVSDATRINLIRDARLQASPTDSGSNILITATDENFQNVLNEPSDEQWRAPVYEIGDPPGIFFRKRFLLDFEFFFIGEQDRKVARTKAWVMYSRVQWSLSTFQLGQRDTFGERAYKLAMLNGYMSAGGGPGTFIWRGKFFIEVETDFAPEA